MYSIVLLIHSWNRWLVLTGAIFALFRAYRGWLGNRPFARLDEASGSLFIGALHLQALLGLTLYVSLSPVVRAALHDMGSAFQSPTLRFWSVEHISLMLSGVIVAQVGRALSRRAELPAQKHRLAALTFSVALGLILLGIPFATRPWFRV
jgi:hypothetical protein